MVHASRSRRVEAALEAGALYMPDLFICFKLMHMLRRGMEDGRMEGGGILSTEQAEQEGYRSSFACCSDILLLSLCRELCMRT